MLFIKKKIITIKDTASGLDGITYSMLKHLPSLKKEYLLKIYNMAWSLSALSEELKHTKITPILKPNKNKYDISSFRTISLLLSHVTITNSIVETGFEWFIEN